MVAGLGHGHDDNSLLTVTGKNGQTLCIMILLEPCEEQREERLYKQV